MLKKIKWPKIMTLIKLQAHQATKMKDFQLRRFQVTVMSSRYMYLSY